MKKILSLLLVALMLVGMLPMNAIHAHAAEQSVTLDLSTSSNRTAFTTSQQVWAQNGITVTNNKGSSTSNIADYTPPRFYKSSEVIITCSLGNITKIELVCSGSSYATSLQKSVSNEAVASGSTVTITPTTPSDTYSISLTDGQVRMGNSITVTYATVDSGECAHTNREEIEAVDATCTTAGNTAGVKCADCGVVLEGNETINALGHSNDEGVVTAPTCTEDGYTLYTCTVCDSTKKDNYVDATGHTYVDGVCSCGAVYTNLEGNYYIATIRSSGNYFYMTSDLGSASTKRYQAVDSGLATLPVQVEGEVGKVFTLVETENKTYYIYANGVEGDNYLGWSSGNSGILVAQADAKEFTVDVQEDGTYLIHFTGDEERYLSLNSTAGSDYFAFYKGTQTQALYLIPVVEAEVPPCEVHNYVDGVCTVCGAIDQDWEGEPDTTDPTDPEETDPTEPTSSFATIDFSTTDQRVSWDTSSQVWANGGATVTNNKSSSTTNVADYSNPARFYKNSDVIIEFKGMTKIEIACNTADYATTLIKSISDTTVSVSVNEKVVTIVPNAAIDSYTITLSGGQVRVDSITVTASTCEHSWGDWVVTSEPTCTVAGVNTATCTLCGETKTETVNATGHSLVYDGNAAFACSKCDYTKEFTLSDISTVKGCSGDGNTYYIKGIVTYVNGKDIYMEDATGGILVYGSASFEGINIGDELLVWDTVTTYSGKIETSGTSTEEYLIVSNNNALPSKTVTIAELVADGTAKEYYGERVVIENVTMGVMGTNNTALTDADGNTINIYKLSGQSDVINENDTVTVTAIVSAYNSTSQLVIDPDTAATDIVEIKDGAAEEIVTVTIAEAKAGTAGDYFQVEGTVTYISGKNVYIQDATGGIVVYLTANAATTQVGDKVKAYGALKLYNGLIELDAVDETNTQFYEILSSGNTVDAQEVTIEGLLADTSNEYLAEKITLNGVYVSYNSYSSQYGNVTYTLTDGNGNTIEIYRVPVASEEECVAGGSIVNVEAIVSAYNGYQLVTDNAKVTVTGTCAHETTELVNDKDATLTAGGYTGDTMCTVCGNYTERGEDTAALTDVDSWGLTLGGDILVNFKIALAESIKDSAQITVAVADKTYTYAAKDYYADGYVYVSASVAAAQMTDEITVTVINGEDQAVKSGYTIKSYAETVLNGDYDDATKALVTAMLHYGAAAQTFFNYNTGAMANEGLASEDDVTIPADAAGEIVVSGSAEGITFYGASLVFENKIAVRFYFTGSAEGIVGAVEKDENDGKFYIEVAGINPQDLDDAVTVEIGELSVSYSPMNYIVRMAEKGDEDLRALVKALYSYHVAAEKLVPDVV